MDDLTLTAKISDDTSIHVSPIDCKTYGEYLSDDNLGGSDGYFVYKTQRNHPMFEILAKAPSFEAAGEIFDMIVVNRAA